MALDPSIILQGQGVNALGAIAAGNQAAAQQRDAMYELQRRTMLAQNGAGIIAGDQNALGALAAFDPKSALDVQQSRLNMDATRLDMRAAEQRMGILSAQEKRAAAQYAAGLSAQQRQAEAQKLEGAVKMGMMIPDAGTWDATMSRVAPDLVGRFSERTAIAAQYMELSDIMKMQAPADPLDGAPKGYMWNQPGNPAAGVAQIPGMQQEAQFRQATPAEASQYGAAAGQFGPDGRFYPVNPPSGMSITQGPDGQLQITQGPGAGKVGAEPKIGDVYTPGEVSKAVSLIDQIANDPALPGVIGSIEGGGGNNVDELNVMQRAYYGDAGLGAIAKIGQLQSQSWLAARAMLKGGGAITDYESKKAEGAVARLSRAQGEKEFRSALQDLRDAITEGTAKLEAAKTGKSPEAAKKSFSEMSYDEILKMDTNTLSVDELDGYMKRLSEGK